MTDVAIVPRDSELFRGLHLAATEHRCVFFAGLPGVGKSLLLQQLSLIAGGAGRRVTLLQWDVARGPFETTETLAHYPEVDGVTHPVIRKAVGVWARDAVADWDREHPDRRDLLIGEVPLIGSRLIELAQRRDDSAERLLAGEGTEFLIPVPSCEIRAVIEAARVREMAAPAHERERANAVPRVVQSLWEEVVAVAQRLGIDRLPTQRHGGTETRSVASSDLAFDPDLYARVYERLLRHRQAARLDILAPLPVQGSVYDVGAGAGDLVPNTQDVARIMAKVRARPEAEIEREVANWYCV